MRIEDFKEVANAVANAYRLEKVYNFFGYKIMIARKWNNEIKILFRNREGYTMPLSLLFKK